MAPDELPRASHTRRLDSWDQSERRRRLHSHPYIGLSGRSDRRQWSGRYRALHSVRTDDQRLQPIICWDRADQWQSAESAGHRAGRDVSRSCPRRWICRCHRRQRGQGAASLHRCQHTRRSDQKVTQRLRQSILWAPDQRWGSMCVHSRWSSTLRHCTRRCRKHSAGWVHPLPLWCVHHGMGRCRASAVTVTTEGRPAVRGRAARRTQVSR